MKKVILSIMITLSSFFFTYPVQAAPFVYYEKVEFKVALEESIKFEDIKSIGITLGIDASAQGLDYEHFDTELIMEENFYQLCKDKVLYGDIVVEGLLIGLDAGGTKFQTDSSVTKVSDSHVVVQIVVYPKDISTTKSTADQKVMEEAIKDHIMTPEQREEYEYYKEIEATTTTTTTTSPGVTVVVTDPVTGEQVIDPDTGEVVTTIITTQTTTTTTEKPQSVKEKEEREAKEKEEKEKRNEKETTILIIMWGVIGCVVVVGGVFAVVKIYKASNIQ